jgi:uncharacterized protein (TIGR00369 family)
MRTQDFDIDTMQSIIDVIRHCVVLNFKVHAIDGQKLTIELPFSENIVGNPDKRIVHGGAITTLLDTTCGMCIPLALGEFQIAPTLDLRIDYMKAAKPDLSIFACAEAYRITNNVVFTRGIAYQDDETQPIAHCSATFMRLSKDITG